MKKDFAGVVRKGVLVLSIKTDYGTVEMPVSTPPFLKVLLGWKDGMKVRVSFEHEEARG